MKRLLALFVSLLLLLCGCSSSQQYKRIHFDGDTLGNSLAQYTDSNTTVVNRATETFSSQIPIYKISERTITDNELQKLQGALGIPNAAPGQTIQLKGNRLTITLADYTDTSRGFFDMTDAQLEKAAWEVFEKLPFMEGEYEYLGRKSTLTISNATGTHIARVGVSFRRILDDVRVVGNEQCYLYFDGSGLVELHIELYRYEKNGTMDLIPLDSLSDRVLTPDSFTVDTEEGTNNIGISRTLQVDRILLLLVNQHSRGCEILQPVYSFVGTATDSDGNQAEFNSIIIAIPESYTYEETE